MSRTIRHGSVIALIVALVAAGCGSSPKSSPSQQQQIAQVLRSYLHAQVSGDGQVACSLLTAAAQRQLTTLVRGASNGLITKRPSCQDAVGMVRAFAGAKLLGALANARVGDVRVQGNNATAVVLDGTAFGQQQVSLQRLGGDWRIVGIPGLGG